MEENDGKKYGGKVASRRRKCHRKKEKKKTVKIKKHSLRAEKLYALWIGTIRHFFGSFLNLLMELLTIVVHESLKLS